MATRTSRQSGGALAAREDRIIAATKTMIAQSSLEEITVREVAKLAGVTTPTLYNRFGSKDRLISAALEHFYNSQVTDTLQAAEEKSKDVYLHIFEIASLYSRACLQQPQFIRALMTMHYKLDTESPVRNLYRDNCRTFATILLAMASRRELRRDTNIPLVAALLTDGCYLIALHWCQGKISDAALADTMILRCAISLANFSRPRVAKALQGTIDALAAVSSTAGWHTD